MWLFPWMSCFLIVHQIKASKEFTVHYTVPDVETNQADAQALCAASGYHLATIPDAQTMEFLEDFLIDDVGSAYCTDAWIALEYEASSGQFKWPNGEEAEYTDWSGLSSEPDQMNAGEVCVRLALLSADVYTWRTTACHMPYFPICEKCITNYIDLVPSLNFVNTTMLDIIQVASPIECAARCMELFQCDKMTYVNHQCSIYSYNIATCSTMQLKIDL
ncbi:uncharacterized protein LOC124124527 [Haliotis rufescens]|uniref:uncharacterized protein LOC124124527 n=1 Tax=Haliotis rufescens TaxID=6454 RepID=UPI00201FA7EE|nr:uncharacterized protein LOC124124527 [Haliotis rufescens]